jgi:acyl-CoA thioester hydrolase
MSEPLHRVHESSLVVRWGDLDAFGHVNNAHYFRFMEQARVEWLEELHLFPSVDRAAPAAATAPQVVVASLSCNFKVPILYPATLALSLFTGRIGRSSLATWHEIRSADGSVLHADGAATLVWIDTHSGRPVPLPDSVRAAATPG